MVVRLTFFLARSIRGPSRITSVRLEVQVSLELVDNDVPQRLQQAISRYPGAGKGDPSSYRFLGRKVASEIGQCTYVLQFTLLDRFEIAYEEYRGLKESLLRNPTLQQVRHSFQVFAK